MYPEDFIPDGEVTLLDVLLSDVRLVDVGKTETLTAALEELRRRA